MLVDFSYTVVDWREILRGLFQTSRKTARIGDNNRELCAEDKSSAHSILSSLGYPILKTNYTANIEV